MSNSVMQVCLESVGVPQRVMPVTIITGFLGSGKTTLDVSSVNTSRSINTNQDLNLTHSPPPTPWQDLDTVILNPGIVRADREAEFESEGIEFIPATNQVVVSNPASGSMSLINLTIR